MKFTLPFLLATTVFALPRPQKEEPATSLKISDITRTTASSGPQPTFTVEAGSASPAPSAAGLASPPKPGNATAQAAGAQPTITVEAGAQPAAVGKCSPEDALKAQELVAGIQANLDLQAQELKGVQTLQILTKNATRPASADGVGNGTTAATAAPAGLTDFQLTQTNVLTIQQQGVDMRARNQILAGQLKSAALGGLDTLANQQVMEMMQVQTLTGSSLDAPALEQLVKEVMDGMRQNTMSLEMAKSQCK